MPSHRCLFLLLVCLWPGLGLADDVRVAVAANFTSTLRQLAADFTAATGHRVVISSASTGKHYAQIRNGARFDLFLAADGERPALLEREGVGIAGSRFVYAEGRLALWLPGGARVDQAQRLLAEQPPRRLAIANPRLAPYGLAAREVLGTWGLWAGLQRRLVRGENVGQAFQFVATGNADAGLVALSQVLDYASGRRGNYHVIPAELHTPIRQHALLLRATPASEAFVAYLRGPTGRALITASGYAVPGDA